MTIDDFQSASTQIGDVQQYSLFTACGPEFSFGMSNAEFMFTKNFNSKVNCFFKRNSSALVAPDMEIANDLIGFAQFQFDLAELYTRRLRKRIYEEKSTFSGAQFLKPLFDEYLKEYAKRSTNAGKETDLGRKKPELKVLHDEVLKEIEELGDFCKMCKLGKKKK